LADKVFGKALFHCKGIYTCFSKEITILRLALRPADACILKAQGADSSNRGVGCKAEARFLSYPTCCVFPKLREVENQERNFEELTQQ